MEWFRWWHGTLTDPKFQWVARKSGQPFTAVISLWVALLERASSVTQGDADVTRGDVTGFDCDDHDVLFCLDDGSCAKIFDAFTVKGMIADGVIANWEKRQPKREDSSAVRTRAYRERKAKESSVTTGDASVTQSDDKSREDKSRENPEPNGSVDSVAADLLGEVREGNGKSGERVTTNIPACPAQQIVDLYHECMPLNPRVKILDDSRKGAIRARWKQAALLNSVKPFGYTTGPEGLKAWKAFFTICAQSDFLTGRKAPQPGKKPFFADIDFLMSPKGFAKSLENRYHEDD
ncbi:hypothetical protein [Paraburkholderia caffeinilytica]|uniref:hypothetical protein n=1 Tax=Paraburkholderia caffeinilytica TaxID=1761016 RepID=UPI0038BAB023